jgi:hypothetical protein
MAAQTIATPVGHVETQPTAFERFAGLCGIAAGVTGFCYAVAFILLRNNLLSALFLLLGGLLASAVFVAVYGRLRETEADLARWGVLLSLVGAGGSLIHGGYDLATALNPSPLPNGDLPNPVDPRGLLTFGVTGLGLFVIGVLMLRSRQFPRGLGSVTYLLAVLLVTIYLGRLIVLNPASPVILAPAVLAGFVVNPAWYIWLGLTLWRMSRA